MIKMFTRQKLIEVLNDPESPDREAILALLTTEERRAILYRLVTVPGIARVDPDRLPEPPYPDREMKRLMQSVSDKLIDLMLDRLLEEID